MSAVVEFVSDVVGGVADAVGDVFEAVGDVVEDVADFVGDTLEKVGDVVQAVIDDPLPVLLSVAGSFVGIPPFVTMGAVTAARGGDLEDIALSMGTAYFAPQVGSAISSTVSSAFIDAGINETFSQVAGQSISKGLVNGTIAEIKGGSFEDGFAGGFTGGMVAGGVGEVADYVKPDVIDLALESGLDLRDATSLFNAGTKAFSSGITAEVTGRGDFATSFTNSAIGSGVDLGTRSLNSAIDKQFQTAASGWNEKDPEGEPVDVSTVGAGIPSDVVSQVQVSDIGFDTPPSDDSSGQPAVSDISVLPEAVAPEAVLAEAPPAETENDFAGVFDAAPIGETVTPDAAQPQADLSLGASEELPESEDAVVQTGAPEPQGALASMAEPAPVDLGSLDQPAVVSDAPTSDNLLTSGLPTDPAEEPPVGGLNAVAPEASEGKMPSLMGIKPTDFTKPLVATAGNIIKQTLMQKRRPPPRQPPRPPARPTGGLNAARPAPPPPPQRMDVASLIPIQRAAPVAPPKTLPSGTKLSPVTDIATLSSLVKKGG